MRMLNPVHPGRFLRTEIIEAHDLSVTEAAKILRVSRPTLSSLLNAKAGLSGRNGPALREGVRRRYGYPHENAEFLRYRPHAQPREEDSRRALQTPACGVGHFVNVVARASISPDAERHSTSIFKNEPAYVRSTMVA